mmetsp:Transcript_6828/g.13889  ORF Transcript_6828/g.13889 Transcript_6828/m.13889 type:complete len:256 (+) Transcript_6828:337-1104(+)
MTLQTPWKGVVGELFHVVLHPDVIVFCSRIGQHFNGFNILGTVTAKESNRAGSFLLHAALVNLGPPECGLVLLGILIAMGDFKNLLPHALTTHYHGEAKLFGLLAAAVAAVAAVARSLVGASGGFLFLLNFLQRRLQLGLFHAVHGLGVSLQDEEQALDGHAIHEGQKDGYILVFLFSVCGLSLVELLHHATSRAVGLSRFATLVHRDPRIVVAQARNVVLIDLVQVWELREGVSDEVQNHCGVVGCYPCGCACC